MIPYGRQLINEKDIQAVVDVLQSDWLTQGPVVEQFEHIVAACCRAKYATAVNSATSALHIACLAAGLGPGDILWTSPLTFVASANCGLHCGATIDFVDINPRTYNMSIEHLEEKLCQAERQNKVPKIVIPVHFAGQSCEMERIYNLANRYGFKIIEDASHAIGGRYKDEPIGSCRYSDMVVFSFHPVKIITTGEGGMVLTNNPDFHAKLVRLRSHGITRDPMLMVNETHGPWYYQQIELGFNFRMTEIQAALGASQMTKLAEFVNQRHLLAERYDVAFTDLPLDVPWQQPENYSAFHLYVIRLKLDALTKSRYQIFKELSSFGIRANVHYIPVHLQPYFRRLGFEEGMYKEAERYYAEAITLPLFACMTEVEQRHVVSCLKNILLDRCGN